MESVQDALGRVEAFPPPNAERPEVEFVQPKDEAITVAVASSHASEDHLRSAAEQIRSELQQFPSLSQVTLRGARDREVTIELSEEALRRHDLSFSPSGRGFETRLRKPEFRATAQPTPGKSSCIPWASAPWVRNSRTYRSSQDRPAPS